MKRCILLVVVFCLLLSMTACAAVSGEGKKPEATAPGATEPDTTEPDVTQPDTTEPDATDPTVPDVKDPEGKNELVYDMANYQWFSDIFEENPEVNWMSMGRYTLRLEGLHTPVIVNLNGLDVLSVTAFDQTVDLGTDGMADDYHDGYSPVQRIRSTYDAVVIHVSFGEMGDGSILITKNQIFKYPKEFDSSIFLWVKDDGTLGYRQTWMFPEHLEQSWDNALEQLTGRDQVLYQTGRAEIVGDELDLIVEDTVVVSDLFDLDAIFAECKAAGNFTEYETLDELFEANKARE